MTIQQLLDEMTNIQQKLLNFINDEENIEENFQNLIDLFEELKISKDKHKLKLILYFISNISINYHRESNFYIKLEKIIQYFKEAITEYYSNIEIFNIFKSNKRILLFLSEEKMIIFNKYIVDTITQSDNCIYAKYSKYFQPEIRMFNHKEENEDEEILKSKEEFQKNRQNGENHSTICELIRNDSIKEFITYTNKTNYSFTSNIEPSIFETNSFLLQNDDITLIQYAAFFGSIQIFKYLMEKGIKLTSQIWLYAIHGQNMQIINLLESNKIKIKTKSYKKCFKEAIKCNHNDIANYIQNNYLQDKNNDLSDYYISFLKYFNFEFLKVDNFCSVYFPILFYYDYYLFIEMQLKEVKFDVNEKILDDSDQSEKTLLHIAVERENVDLVELLLNYDEIDVNLSNNISTCKNTVDKMKKTEENRNALIIAVEKGNAEIVQLLLNNDKTDVNCIYKYEINVKEELEEYRVLSDIDDNYDYDDEVHFTPNGDSLNELEEKTPLIIAVENNNSEITNILLSRKDIDVNFKYKHNKNRKTVTDSGFDDFSTRTRTKAKTEKEKTALHIAVENGNIEIVNLLLSNEKIDINNIYSINENITQKNYNYVTSDPGNGFLYKDDTNSSEEYQKTALILAIENDYTEIAKLLIENEKIDVNIPYIYSKSKENENETKAPLELAVQKGNADIVECLINNKNTICDFEKIFKMNTKILIILINHYKMINNDNE